MPLTNPAKNAICYNTKKRFGQKAQVFRSRGDKSEGVTHQLGGDQSVGGDKSGGGEKLVGGK